jgi:DNA-binding transcriptional ArsR family regulator
MRKTELSSGVVRHHLEILQEAGKVRRRKGERADEVLFFTDENEGLWQIEEGRALFGHETRRSVASHVASTPEASASEIAQALDLDPETIRYHVETLLEQDLVEQVNETPPRRVMATEPLKDWLDAMRKCTET